MRDVSEGVIETGIYANASTQQWEAWVVNQRTKAKARLSWCCYDVPPEAKRLWEREVWRSLLPR